MGSYNDCRYNWFKRAVGDRFFTDFDEVAQSYVLFDDTVNTSGNTIIIEADFSINNRETLGQILTLHDSDNSNFLGIRTVISGGDSYVKFNSAGVTPGDGATPVEMGVLHNLKVSISKDTGDFQVLLDGALEYSNTHSNPSLLKSAYEVSVGARKASTGQSADTFFEGIIANAKITTDAGVVFNMPIDQNYTPTNNTVLDLASGNNGTFVNVADGDSTFYQLTGNSWVDGEGNALEIAY